MADDIPGAVQLEPKLARALIRSLTRGTAVPYGAKFIHVGHGRWLAAQLELLGEIAEDGYSDTKFVRGAYGAGKSHFLSVVQEAARGRGWATSHIECRFDRVEIDRFETLYPALVKKLRTDDTTKSPVDADGDQSDVLHAILAKWADAQFRAVGIRADARTRPFDADSRVFEHLARRLFRGAVPMDFARALTAYALASLAGDLETQTSIRAWLGAGAETVDVPSHYLRRGHRSIGRSGDRSSKGIQLKPIKAGTVHDAMRGLLWLIRDAGYAGLVLCIDEVEALARLSSRKRQDRALQALREYVDQAGGDESHKWLCMYLAATPEMFDNEQYFPRYDALASRIQAVSDSINWRAPVIDFDKTPLGPDELGQMAAKIRDLYCVAYGHDAVHPRADEFLKRIVPEVAQSKVRMARPRLLSRIVIDELERSRSSGSNYSPPDQLDKVIARAASKLEEGEQE